MQPERLRIRFTEALRRVASVRRFNPVRVGARSWLGCISSAISVLRSRPTRGRQCAQTRAGGEGFFPCLRASGRRTYSHDRSERPERRPRRAVATSTLRRQLRAASVAPDRSLARPAKRAPRDCLQCSPDDLSASGRGVGRDLQLDVAWPWRMASSDPS